MTAQAAAADFDDIPEAMRTARRWLLYKFVPGEAGKKPRKVPFYISGKPRSGMLDGPEDVAQLASFDDAVAALQARGCDSLGFALGPDGSGNYWQGVDLDDVEDHPGLRFIADDLPGYVERSPSGRGLHAIGYGRRFDTLGSNSTGIEAYPERRFFTVTGESAGLGEIADIADFVENRLGPLHGQALKRERPTVEAPTLSPDEVARMAPELRSALEFMDPDDYGVWIAAGHALRPLGDVGREIWATWAKGSAKHDPTETETRWASFRPDHTGPAAVFAMAQAAGWPNPRASKPSAEVGEACAPEFSDESLALEFADRHADLRWVQAHGKWMMFDGQRWRADVTLLGLSLAREVCRDAAARCNKASIARALSSAQTVAAVERLARADRRLAATPDQWDADPWLLNTPGGVMLLKTGQVRPHHPTDYMTKITAVAPGGDCPLWLSFLGRVTGGDKALEGFLQRIAGYALTGDVSAHALFFAYGLGANGKSVFVETLAGILGDYHRTSPIETFVVSHSDRHPTELAALQGARLVTATETEEGRHWAESKIKALTGGDRISARFMRQDFFEFPPQFKLLISGNHKPGLKSVDEAIRRRFHLIPFRVTIPLGERDPHLVEKLRTEWPGILAWMIQGCLDFQVYGLEPPDAVREATEEYLQAEDMLAAWLDDDCEIGTSAWETSNRLFRSWSDWCERANEPKPQRRKFTDALLARGFKIQRGANGVRGYQGLKLRPWNPSA